MAGRAARFSRTYAGGAGDGHKRPCNLTKFPSLFFVLFAAFRQRVAKGPIAVPVPSLGKVDDVVTVTVKFGM